MCHFQGGCSAVLTHTAECPGQDPYGLGQSQPPFLGSGCYVAIAQLRAVTHADWAGVTGPGGSMVTEEGKAGEEQKAKGAESERE